MRRDRSRLASYHKSLYNAHTNRELLRIAPMNFLERQFELSARGTTIATEFAAGVTTFLTMCYIIFVQPAMLSGKMFGR